MNCEDCEHLSPTEEEQDQMTDKKPHVCKLGNFIVYHGQLHPRFRKPHRCPLEPTTPPDAGEGGEL